MAEAVSGLTGSLQGTVTGLANRGQSFIDSIIPPETRNKILAWISKFAAEKPKLAVHFPFSLLRPCFLTLSLSPHPYLDAKYTC